MDPIALRFQLGPSELLAKDLYIYGDPWRKAQSTVWRDTMFTVALCAFGLFAAFEAGNRLLMLLFGTALLARLTIPWEQKQKLRAGLAELAEKRIRRRDVSFRLDDQGVHEEVEGVRSFAPWPAVKAFATLEQVLLLQLAGELWAVVPRVAFLGAGAPSEEEFVAMLRRRGIAEHARASNPRDGGI